MFSLVESHNGQSWSLAVRVESSLSELWIRRLEVRVLPRQLCLSETTADPRRIHNA